MSEKREPLEETMDILIEDDIIQKIEKNIQCHVEKVIDATGKVIMPGLINTHSHVPMSIFRETLDGYHLQDWLEQKIWPMEEKLTNEDIYYASMLSFLEMIQTGTTTINDMYFITEEIIKAALETGIRLQTTRTLQNSSGNGKERLNELEQIIQIYQNKYETISLNVGIHGFYTSNRSYIEQCANLARKYQLPVHIHFCENHKEVEDIKREYQVQSPVELIKKYFQGLHVILAHCVKLSKQEIEELKDNDIAVSHCPISNLKLGCGIANISYMQHQGITVSLGTDGQGSGSNLDLFETMKFTSLLQKGMLENPKELLAYEVLKMATINGAKTLQLQDKIGSIEEGKQADIIILDMNQITTIPVNNLFSEIVYNVKGTNVDTTIVNGKILMENRKLTYQNEAQIFQTCEQIIKRIKE